MTADLLRQMMAGAAGAHLLPRQAHNMPLPKANILHIRCHLDVMPGDHAAHAVRAQWEKLVAAHATKHPPAEAAAATVLLPSRAFFIKGISVILCISIGMMAWGDDRRL
jgi:hypothetical protein